jgi:hypothetical protein
MRKMRKVSVGGKGSRNHTNNTANALHDTVNLLLANGIVATGVVVGGILLAADQHLRVEERSVLPSADLVNRRGVEIEEDGPGDIFAVARLGEEGLVRAAIIGNILRVGVGTAIGTETVLEEVAERERSVGGGEEGERGM